MACSGDPLNANPVRVLVTDRPDPTDAAARVWFNGTVPIGGDFVVEAETGGAARFGNLTYAYGVLGALEVQRVRFSTSCSVPLRRATSSAASRSSGRASRGSRSGGPRRLPGQQHRGGAAERSPPLRAALHPGLQRATPIAFDQPAGHHSAAAAHAERPLPARPRGRGAQRLRRLSHLPRAELGRHHARGADPPVLAPAGRRADLAVLGRERHHAAVHVQRRGDERQHRHLRRPRFERELGQGVPHRRPPRPLHVARRLDLRAAGAARATTASAPGTRSPTSSRTGAALSGRRLPGSVRARHARHHRPLAACPATPPPART